VSKKSAIISEKTISSVAMMPIRAKPPPSETCPMIEKSGLSTIDFGHLQRPAVRVLAVRSPRADVRDRLDDDRQHRRDGDADEQGALDLADDEHAGEQQADDEHQQRPSDELAVDAQRDEAAARPDDTRVGQADDRQEEADPDRDRRLELGGHRLEDRAAEPGEHQHRDEQALEDDQAHGLGPGHLRGGVDGDDRVDAQPGGQGERIATPDAHEDRHDPGDQRGDAGDRAERQLLAGDVRARQDDRVEDHDVGHREERDEATTELAAHRGTAGADREVAVQPVARPDPGALAAPGGSRGAGHDVGGPAPVGGGRGRARRGAGLLGHGVLPGHCRRLRAATACHTLVSGIRVGDHTEI
jgi:hypothetical protein